MPAILGGEFWGKMRWLYPVGYLSHQGLLGESSPKDGVEISMVNDSLPDVPVLHQNQFLLLQYILKWYSQVELVYLILKFRKWVVL